MLHMVKHWRNPLSSPALLYQIDAWHNPLNSPAPLYQIDAWHNPLSSPASLYQMDTREVDRSIVPSAEIGMSFKCPGIL